MEYEKKLEMQKSLKSLSTVSDATKLTMSSSYTETEGHIYFRYNNDVVWAEKNKVRVELSEAALSELREVNSLHGVLKSGF